ncbi:hypothetical protein Cni_G06076 [Canna indica]|uniref:SWIM-type domain-containing protein n=1 Tax=Canna indica TaxID=4628 RepID=A0AAQ3JWE4_9LILI|nr:hypothetical protein Cni_G06076 [Canna indica]
MFNIVSTREFMGAPPVFQRLYNGFDALRKGFLQGCRPIIGFDGCFLKTFLGGQLLSAVGRDRNNQMFSIAWAVVEGENYESWSWLLGLLFDDLGIAQGYGIALISDQQKGLEYAIKQRVPAAEHRNCARHIYANWKKKHPGHVLKSLFWRAVRCTIESDFKKTMSEMQATSDRAHQDFLAVGVTKFCQTYINVGCKSDVVSNNLSETFNGYILKARGKLIIDMLEDIRRMLMVRMYEKRELMLKNNDTICPSIRKKLKENKEEIRYCHVTPAGNMKFEVQELDKSSVVNLMNRTCSCRKWDLCGIPCNHAISCINWLKDDPDKYVDDYYKRDTYLKTYDLMLQPLTGKDTWPEVDGSHVLPPPVKKMPGRPKKKRRRDMHKDETGTRLSRGGLVITCHICFQDGHNRRSCPLRGHPSSTQSGDNEPRMSDEPASRGASRGGSTSRSGRSSSDRGGRGGTTSNKGGSTSTFGLVYLSVKFQCMILAVSVSSMQSEIDALQFHIEIDDILQFHIEIEANS